MATKTLEEQNIEQKEAIRKLIDRVDELEAQLKAEAELRNSCPSNPEDYVLVDIGHPGGLMAYDGLKEGRWVYHESLPFTHDSAWSPSAIRDRALSVVDRACPGDGNADGQNRYGYVRAQDERGIWREECRNLPPFDPSMRLEVIVRIVKPE